MGSDCKSALSGADASSDAEKKYVRGFVGEMKGHGISLFKATNNNTHWNKIEAPDKTSDSEPKTTPCNN